MSPNPRVTDSGDWDTDIFAGVGGVTLPTAGPNAAVTEGRGGKGRQSGGLGGEDTPLPITARGLLPAGGGAAWAVRTECCRGLPPSFTHVVPSWDPGVCVFVFVLRK